ncbi:MAG: hypothetical protein ACI9BH_003456 [Paracoccaceae bacterium]
MQIDLNGDIGFGSFTGDRAGAHGFGPVMSERDL